MDEAALSPQVPPLSFDRKDLHDLRRLVAERAAAAGMAEDRIIDFVLAASEVGTNSVEHGGGNGIARVWREAEALVLEVRDRGRFAHLPIPKTRPAPTQERGRGLWIVDQLCDSVRISSGADGTSVRLHMSLA